MSLRVLRAALDTVEVSYAGSLSEETMEKLDQAKAMAVDRNGPISLTFGLQEVQVMPKAFGYWTWRLVDPRFHIVAKRKAGSGQAVAQIRLSSFGLANEHPEMLMVWVVSLLAQLGTLKELAVSRADVCVDIQGWEPTPEEMRNIVTPVSYRATHGTEKQTQTYQFGKKTVLRVYNKSEELAKSKKEWLRDVWGQSSEYDPTQDVWRVEFQAASDVLRQLGITNAAALLDRRNALLDYGLRWAQLRVPTGDSTKTRWPEDERWTLIRKASFSGVPLQRRMEPAELMSLDAAKTRLIGLAALAGAYFDTDEYMKALQQLSLAAEVHMMEEGIDFAPIVEEKRRRILSEGV
jgi:hypothetical protein